MELEVGPKAQAVRFTVSAPDTLAAKVRELGISPSEAFQWGARRMVDEAQAGEPGPPPIFTAPTEPLRARWDRERSVGWVLGWTEDEMVLVEGGSVVAMDMGEAQLRHVDVQCPSCATWTDSSTDSDGRCPACWQPPEARR
jgi:hypothetical protein